MHPVNRVVYRFNLCLLNLLGAALFLVAAYDLQLSTHLGAALSEFSGASLLVATVSIGLGAYRLALWAQWLALASPMALLYLCFSSATDKNSAGMSFLINLALGLTGYFALLVLAVWRLVRQRRQS